MLLSLGLMLAAAACGDAEVGRTEGDEGVVETPQNPVELPMESPEPPPEVPEQPPQTDASQVEREVADEQPSLPPAKEPPQAPEQPSPPSVKEPPTPAPPVAELPEEAPAEDGAVGIQITVGEQAFSTELYNNPAAQAFVARLPITITMDELNGNEKFHYLSEALPTEADRPENIRPGELMLYGADCLVLFYEGFSSSYSYTSLGQVEDASGLADALGSGSVQVTFQRE